MPSALVQRISVPPPTLPSSATSNSGGDYRQPPNKHYSLPPDLIKELSLHAPSLLKQVPETLHRHHIHRAGNPHSRVSSAVVKPIAAPVVAVWAVVRRFDNPLTYKRFLKSCRLVAGDGAVGTLREVRVISGLPAAWSTERLDVFDDEKRVIGFSVVGGEHRLSNYRSVTTVHENTGGGAVVVESYTVDVPPGNTRDDTCIFADTIVRCNLNSLAQFVENSTTANSPPS